MTIISLEGNIGSGKEDFIQFFKKYFSDEIIFIEDSIYNWNEKKMLTDFYKNPERWSFTLQVMSISQKFKKFLGILPHKKKGSVILTHRSPMSDKLCFEKACLDSGYMTQKEDEIYQTIFENYRIPKYHGVIYLKSNVNKCYETIISKTNKAEKNINFDYLRRINTNYENWTEAIKKEDIPLVEINIEEYRNIDGNEMLQNKLYNIIINKFPQLEPFSRNRKKF